MPCNLLLIGPMSVPVTASDDQLARVTKTCGGCNQDLPLREFWSDKSRPDGLRPQCRSCSGSKQEARRKRVRIAAGLTGRPLRSAMKRDRIRLDPRKLCTSCLQVKPLEDFYRDQSCVDGRSGRCKPCKSKLYSAARLALSEDERRFLNEASARRRDTASPEVRARQLERTRAWRAAPKQKEDDKRRHAADYKTQKGLARSLVQTAIRSKKVTRLPCEVCGASPTHGHHDDYSKPLDVRWLCRSHHADHHRVWPRERKT